LFRDLGDMVVEQGTLLDSVEYNIETVGREMKGAVEELEQATVYQKNTGRRKCILLLLLLIVGAVVRLFELPWCTEDPICLLTCLSVQIVLIYKPRSHSTPLPPPPPMPSVLPPKIGSSLSIKRCKIAMKPRSLIPDEAISSSTDISPHTRPVMVRRRRRAPIETEE
jgi:hypothetical protein